MGEIRFVGTGETRGYPYLVCKKYSSVIVTHSVKKNSTQGKNIYGVFYYRLQHFRKRNKLGAPELYLIMVFPSGLN